MGKHIPSKIIICICLIYQASYIFAGVGTESLQFLKIKPSARVASIGDGYVGLADDSNASFYNPAGLARLTTPEISLMHLAYIGETSYEYAAGVIPAGKNMTLGAYVIYLNYGSITKTTEDNTGVYSGTAGAFNPNNGRCRGIISNRGSRYRSITQQYRRQCRIRCITYAGKVRIIHQTFNNE